MEVAVTIAAAASSSAAATGLFLSKFGEKLLIFVSVINRHVDFQSGFASRRGRKSCQEIVLGNTIFFVMWLDEPSFFVIWGNAVTFRLSNKCGINV
jgi:hypothetical protein